MGRLKHALKVALIYFSFKFWVGWVGLGEDFFSFFLCSHKVPNGFPSRSLMFLKFSMCSPRVFPIAPRFNPICFAQRPRLLTYLGGPKGEVLHFSIESSISGGVSIISNFFVMDQSKNNSFPKKKKKVGLVRHPQLIKTQGLFLFFSDLL